MRKIKSLLFNYLISLSIPIRIKTLDAFLLCGFDIESIVVSYTAN